MGVASSLPFRHVPLQRIPAWILLVALLIALALLGFAALVGATSPGHSPESEPLLMGPFRWTAETTLA